MKFKRVLVCANYPSEPDKGSGGRRLLDLIQLLCADGCKVWFFAANAAAGPGLRRMLQRRGVAVFEASKMRIEDLLGITSFDLALFSAWRLAETYGPALDRSSPGTRVLIDSPHLDFLHEARRLFQGATPAEQKAAVDKPYSSELVRELRTYAAADAVLTLSQRDADLLNDVLDARGLAQIAPELEQQRLSRVPLSRRRGILLLGSFSDERNIERMEILCKEIVARLNPELLLHHPIYVLAEQPDAGGRRWLENLQQVKMVGWVPSVRPYLERARVSVFLLDDGVETRRKLAQSLLAGTPAIATRIGARSLGLQDGRQVLVADDAQGIAAALTQLLAGSRLWKRLSEQGRALAVATHGREAALKRVGRLWETIMARERKPGRVSVEPEQPVDSQFQRYQKLRGQIQEVVRTSLPKEARLIVVSKGDEELLQLDGRSAWHFPQTPDGIYAGCYPADSRQAIAEWTALRQRTGADCMLFPSTALWWLEHYEEFRQHLEDQSSRVTTTKDLCLIYHLRPPSEPAPHPAVRLIAFYRPQFYPIPENDAWWGEGFTDWTNVGKAVPLFDGHDQPRLPADLGFYDLRLAETREAQANLARQHGLHGFCYYHYWFKGKRLLGRPLDELLLSGQPELPFCLCWDNQPWSRPRPDRQQEVLQEQRYSPDDDLAHIRWLLPALADSRAIQIEGKPVFLVYQGQDLPDPARTITTWRREVDRAGLPGIYLIAVETVTDAGWDATEVGFDAKVLLQPQFTMLSNSGSEIPVAGSVRVFDYQRAWPKLANPEPVAYRRYQTVFPAWDDSPQRGQDGVVIHNSSPGAYEQWLRHAVAKTRSQGAEHRIVFLNAWNQWGDGCHLEPDLKWGRAYLEATRRVVREASHARLLPPGKAFAKETLGQRSGLAIQGRIDGVCVSSQAPGAGDRNSDAQNQQLTALRALAPGEKGSDYVPLSKRDYPSELAPVKAISFYLPQFHPIPENDQWWGKGFTEWTNVAKALPQFAGHYQPHLPGELGFYDLRLQEVQQRQVELARKYGLHGFCFYHYWFAGKPLLELPLRQFMANPAISFPFCICWANENWTRRWDGRDNEILIGQNHSEASDLAFIRDAAPVLRHHNYIRINGRPLLIVYRVRLLPNPAETAARWRDWCRKAGLGNPYLVAAQVFERIDPREIGFDAAVEFPPNTPGPRAELNAQLPLLNPDYTGNIYPYADLVKLMLEQQRPPYQLFKAVCPAWDNEPRRPGRGSTYAFSTPAEYGRWLSGACRFALAEPEAAKRLVFINAWNEWGEGAHLEPDQLNGYAYLQTTADVLRSLPMRTSPSARDWTILFVSHDAEPGGAQMVLLNLISWLKKHTSIMLKVVCLENGSWLRRFQDLADTIVWSEVKQKHAATSGEDMAIQLRAFCAGKPDLIYGNSVASGRVYEVLNKLGAPILTHFHELEMSIKRYASGWIGDVLKDSACYIACAGAVRDNLVANHGVAPEKISIVPDFIRSDTVSKPLEGHERAVVRRRLGLAQDKLLVFGCGLGMPFRKGTDLFIKVAQQFRREGREDVAFYWVGELTRFDTDAKYGVWADQIAALAKEALPCVTFLGNKDNPRDYFRVADVFLLSSREDPFPLVALEAAACAVPIICFEKSGGMPEFVAEDAGCVVPFEDVDAMAQRLALLLDDPERRRTLGARAREKLRAGFTAERTSPHIFSICRRIAGRQPSVSVIVPNYNHAPYLRDRLESIFEQTYKDFEVILLDDASSDNSVEILRQYRERADVHLIQNEQNSGSTFKQWLKGIERAKGDIIWVAESDDRCEPDFLECLLPAFKNRRVKLAYCNSYIMDETGATVGDYTACDYLTSLSPTKWTKDYLVSAEQEVNDGLGVKNTILSASAVLFRRFELETDMRRVLETMRLAGDWYFMIHAIIAGEVHYSARKLNYHRRHAESVIGKLLRQNRVGDLFGEFHTVQSEIFRRYPLLNGFLGKWEQYLRDQWKAFYPDRPFEHLNEHYPFSRVREQILSSSAGGGCQEQLEHGEGLTS